MNIARLPARCGYAWITQGFALARAQPFPVLIAVAFLCPIALLGPFLLASSFYFFVTFDPLAYALFAFFLLIFAPFIQVFALALCHAFERKEILFVETFLEPVSSRFGALLRVGCLYGLAAAGMLFVLSYLPVTNNSIADPSCCSLLSPSSSLRAPNDRIAAPWMLLSVLLPMTIGGFAPFLVVWHRLSAWQAICFSLLAFWRNVRAVLTEFAIVLMALGLVFIVIGSLKFVPGRIWILLPPVLLIGKIILALFLSASALSALGSYYFSCRDLFGMAEETLAPPDAQKSNQWTRRP
jgi:hypothetical protein